MPKKNAALDAIAGGGTAQETAAPAAKVVQFGAEATASKPDTTPTKPAKELAKVMLYLHPKVARKFKEMALVENCKAHDLYLAALDQYLTQQGHGGLKSVTER